MFDLILDAIAGSNWTYLLCFALAFGDVLFPLLPAETAVIAAGALANTGDLSLGIIIVVSAAGAILGDNTAYWLGRWLKGPVQNRLFSGSGATSTAPSVGYEIEVLGTLIFVGRFIPGGRSAITFGAGVLEYPYRRFLFFDVIAGVLWASYAGLIVRVIGGEAFEESPIKGILLALAIAFIATGLVEGVRWLRRRQIRQAGMVEPGIR